MKDRIMSAPARTASRALAAFAVMALSAVTSVSLAQQAPQAQPAQPKPAAPKPPPKPAAKPQAQPQQPPAQQQQQQQQQQAAPPPAAGDQQQAAQSAEPQLIYSPWVKLCNKDADPKAKRVCVTVKDGRVESGLLVVSVAIIEMDGEQRKLLRMSLPYGVALQHGTRLIVDQAQPATAPYVTCLPPVVPPGGCIADYEANADLIARMKKANLLTVQAIHMNGQAMSPQLDLKDFAKAYDGPPTDPKVFEAQQKKLQDELQKRAEEARKKLEMAQPPAAGTPPAPAPAPAR